MKKALSLLMIGAYLLFNSACAIYKTYNEPVASVTAKDDIVGVTKTSGEEIKIPKDNPARAEGEQIVFGIKSRAKSEIKSFRQDAQGVVYEITAKDGQTIRNVNGKVVGDKIVLPSSSIPFSEVKSILVRRIHTGKSILVTVGVLVGVFGLLVIAAISEMSFFPAGMHFY